MRREIARDELTIGEARALPDISAIRELLLREPIVWERRVAFDDTDVGAMRALQMTVARTLVASALVKNGMQPGVAFGACNSACVEDLCRSGLNTLWETARDASAKMAMSGSLALSAAGKAGIDDYAHPVSLSGTWIGTLAANSEASEIQGDIRAGTTSPIE